MKGTSLTNQLKEKQSEFDTKFEKNFNVDNKVYQKKFSTFLFKLQTVASW